MRSVKVMAGPKRYDIFERHCSKYRISELPKLILGEEIRINERVCKKKYKRQHKALRCLGIPPPSWPTSALYATFIAPCTKSPTQLS
jgi:hypothetical protein